MNFLVLQDVGLGAALGNLRCPPCCGARLSTGLRTPICLGLLVLQDAPDVGLGVEAVLVDVVPEVLGLRQQAGAIGDARPECTCICTTFEVSLRACSVSSLSHGQSEVAHRSWGMSLMSAPEDDHMLKMSDTQTTLCTSQQ